MSRAELQCALAFSCTNACQVDLQPVGKVNHCMVWGQSAKAAE